MYINTVNLFLKPMEEGQGRGLFTSKGPCALTDTPVSKPLHRIFVRRSHFCNVIKIIHNFTHTPPSNPKHKKSCPWGGH